MSSKPMCSLLKPRKASSFPFLISTMADDFVSNKRKDKYKKEEKKEEKKEKEEKEEKEKNEAKAFEEKVEK